MGHLSTVSLNGSGSGAVSSVTAGNGISVNSGDPANPIVSVNKIYGSSGVLTGGVLSTGAGATQYSISDGTGVIVNTSGTITSVSWSGKSNITPTNIASTLLTWVAINSSGNVVEKSTPFTASEIRANIFLGVVVHVDKATVDGVNNEQLVAYQPLSSVFDLADVIGFMNASGNVFSANGANLQINKSAGEIYAFGSNYPTDSTNPHVSSLGALAPVTFQYRFSNGTNGVTGTSIDPNNLDNLSGGLTAVGTNKWSVQRIYSFVSNNVKIQRGQADYISSEVAIDSILFSSYQTEASIAANGLLRGWLVVKQGATDLSNTAQAIFLAAPKFGDSASGASSSGALSASTLQVSYDNSSEPEILTDSTRGAVTIKRGSAADTNTIIEGLNGAGSTTFSVTGSGVVTGAGGFTTANSSATASVYLDSNVAYVYLTDGVDAPNQGGGYVIAQRTGVSQYSGAGIGIADRNGDRRLYVGTGALIINGIPGTMTTNSLFGFDATVHLAPDTYFIKSAASGGNFSYFCDGTEAWRDDGTSFRTLASRGVRLYTAIGDTNPVGAGLTSSGMQLYNGAFALTHVAPTLSASSTLTWPAANAAGALTNDGSGGLSWSAAGSGANTALSNLASVAINTTLVSDTDVTDDLGSSSVRWSRLYANVGRFGTPAGNDQLVVNGTPGSEAGMHRSSFNGLVTIGNAGVRLQFKEDSGSIVGAPSGIDFGIGSGRKIAFDDTDSGGPVVGNTYLTKSTDTGGNFSYFYDGTEVMRDDGTNVQWLQSRKPGIYNAMGDSSARATFGGNQLVNTTEVGNVGTGVDDLQSVTLLANTLLANGDRVDILASGIYAGNANNKTISLIFGGTTLLSAGPVAANGGAWMIRATVIRTGATAQIAASCYIGSSLVAATVSNSTPAETLSGAITIKTQGEATANDDVVSRILTVDYFPVK